MLKAQSNGRRFGKVNQSILYKIVVDTEPLFEYDKSLSWNQLQKYY